MHTTNSTTNNRIKDLKVEIHKPDSRVRAFHYFIAFKILKFHLSHVELGKTLILFPFVLLVLDGCLILNIYEGARRWLTLEQ